MSEIELMKEILSLRDRVETLEKDRDLNIWIDDEFIGYNMRMSPCDFAELAYRHIKDKSLHVQPKKREETAEIDEDLEGK